MSRAVRRGRGTGGGTLAAAERKRPAALASGRAVDAAGQRTLCSATRRGSHPPGRLSRPAWLSGWRRRIRSSSSSTRSSASTAATPSGSASRSTAGSATAPRGTVASSGTRSSPASAVASTRRRMAGRTTPSGNRRSATERRAGRKARPPQPAGHPSWKASRQAAKRHRPRARRIGIWRQPPASLPRIAATWQTTKTRAAFSGIPVA